jgi:hypothetical protein
MSLATHGLSYTPAQVRGLSQRDRDALLREAQTRATDRAHAQAQAEAREMARSSLPRRKP